MTQEVTLEGDRVSFGKRFSVRFERTLRIPDDGRTYPLPPSFGAFPVRRVDDYLDRVPEAWRAHGGVFLPMYAREAMWLSFHGEPTALKVGAGKVCAITGEPFDDELSAEQNYVVAPEQPWLDGICVKKGVIRQFVAVPLGLGATVEGQITGEEKHGGIQLVAFAPRPGFVPSRTTFGVGSFGVSPAPCAPAAFGAPPASVAPMGVACGAAASTTSVARAPVKQMGLGAGGTMGQLILPDPYRVCAWDAASKTRCFVHLVSAEDFSHITGEPMPTTPVDARAYAQAGFPFFALDEHGKAGLEGKEALSKIKSVQALVPPKDPHEDASIEPKSVQMIAKKLKDFVRDGLW